MSHLCDTYIANTVYEGDWGGKTRVHFISNNLVEQASSLSLQRRGSGRVHTCKLTRVFVDATNVITLSFYCTQDTITLLSCTLTYKHQH